MRGSLRTGVFAATLVVIVFATTASNGERFRRDAPSELRLFRRYRIDQDPATRDELVSRFLPLAQALARRYWARREPLEDLVQVAGIGLVKAIDRFDPERGLSFSAYAIPTIVGELKRYFRDSAHPVHIPQRIQGQLVQVEAAARDLQRRLGRSPAPRDIAKATGLPLQSVMEATQAAIACDMVSLEAARSMSHYGRGGTYAESVGFEDERYAVIEYTASIAPALKALSPRDRLILHLRFFEDLTQAQIARELGISQMHVSRLLRRSLARLRAVAKAQASRESTVPYASANGAPGAEAGVAARRDAGAGATDPSAAV